MDFFLGGGGASGDSFDCFYISATDFHLNYKHVQKLTI